MRMFRLMRLFKLVRSWTRMQRLLGDIYSTLRQGKWFLVVFILFMFISALVGMQLLANRMAFDPETGEVVPFDSPEYGTAYRPRWNFDTMHYTLATIVQLLSLEDWHRVYYDARRSAGTPAIVYVLLGALARRNTVCSQRKLVCAPICRARASLSIALFSSCSLSFCSRLPSPSRLNWCLCDPQLVHRHLDLQLCVA